MFLIGSIDSHPDLVSASWTMSVLSSSIDSIASISSASIPSIPNQAVTSYTYSNQLVTYC